MFLRRLIKSILYFIQEYRIRHRQYSQVRNRINEAKARNFYRRYPIKEHPPLAMNYPQWERSDHLWYDFYYSVLGRPDEGFISVPMYYYIESCLNHRMLTYGIKEKNFYNKFFINIPTPDTIIRKINGFYYDRNYKNILISEAIKLSKKYDKLILKPSVNSGGGRSTALFSKIDDELLSGKDILDAAFLEKCSDFVIQEFVKQHHFFKQFNPDSNNTIRVFIYRSVKNDSINILHCLLRIGSKGNFLDHDHLGGVVISVDSENRGSKYALDKYGTKYYAINGIDLTMKIEIPFMNEIRNLATKIAGDVYYGRLLALDFTVDQGGNALLLEINCWRNGIDQYQMHNGSLFKEFSSEILDYYQSHKPEHWISI